VLDVTGRVDFEELAATSVMGCPHGDLNYGNLILKGDGGIVGIDWRESFGNGAMFGDLRYDLAKLLAGCFVHWDNARRGDFRPWDAGHDHATVMRDWLESHRMFKHVEIIGALTLLHSAPLHAPPLDEILIARGCAWLEEAL
jgi:thiamine kinase-like enzyme